MSKKLSILAFHGFFLGTMNALVYACGSGQDCTDGTDQPVKDCPDSNCE